MLSYNREVRICFVHKGHSPFLEYAVAQAASCGYNPIVIGDEAARCAEGEFAHISQYMQDVDEFSRHYEHASVNQMDYERFCFERWFVIRCFLRENPGPSWIADHDVLVYDGLDVAQDWMVINRDRLSTYCFNSSWLNFFPNTSSIDFATDFFLSIYKSSEALTALSHKFSLNNQPHMSDMHAFLELGWQNGGKVLDVALTQHSFGIDKNIRDVDGYSSRNGHKLAAWKNEKPYVFTENRWKRFLCFHFQGQSKYLMQHMHTIKNYGFKNYLQNFDEVVDAFSSTEISDMVRKEFSALRYATQ